MKKSWSPTVNRKCFALARVAKTETETAQRPVAEQAATD
jgi:hypothetical protein